MPEKFDISTTLLSPKYSIETLEHLEYADSVLRFILKYPAIIKEKKRLQMLVGRLLNSIFTEDTTYIAQKTQTAVITGSKIARDILEATAEVTSMYSLTGPEKKANPTLNEEMQRLFEIEKVVKFRIEQIAQMDKPKIFQILGAPKLTPLKLDDDTFNRLSSERISRRDDIGTDEKIDYNLFSLPPDTLSNEATETQLKALCELAGIGVDETKGSVLSITRSLYDKISKGEEVDLAKENFILPADESELFLSRSAAIKLICLPYVIAEERNKVLRHEGARKEGFQKILDEKQGNLALLKEKLHIREKARSDYLTPALMGLKKEILRACGENEYNDAVETKVIRMLQDTKNQSEGIVELRDQILKLAIYEKFLVSLKLAEHDPYMEQPEIAAAARTVQKLQHSVSDDFKNPEKVSKHYYEILGWLLGEIKLIDMRPSRTAIPDSTGHPQLWVDMGLQYAVEHEEELQDQGFYKKIRDAFPDEYKAKREAFLSDPSFTARDDAAGD